VKAFLKPAQIEAIIRLRTPRGPEKFIPIRYVRAPCICWFCGVDIPRARPGSRTGERGTKAWWWREQNVWECLACRSAAVDASIASEAAQPADLFEQGGVQ